MARVPEVTGYALEPMDDPARPVASGRFGFRCEATYSRDSFKIGGR
jgi:hypothetical protein